MRDLFLQIRPHLLGIYIFLESVIYTPQIIQDVAHSAQDVLLLDWTMRRLMIG
jgi:hypothetical protein